MSEIRYTVPKGLKTVVEMITPDRATKLLQDAPTNRNISWDAVKAFKTEILRGSWRTTHQGLGLDTEGRLVDGQHRLWAIIDANVAVPMNVTYGIPEDARTAIDKGRKRSVADELKMFKGVVHAKALVSHTTQCIKLYAKYHEAGKVQIQTMPTLLEWLDVFKEGIVWSTETFDTSSASPALRRSAVAGSLAFAYRSNPDKIAAFGTKLRDGVNLTKHEPAWALRKALLESSTVQRFGAQAFTDAVAAMKTLQAAYAHLRNEQLSKILEGTTGFNYFAKQYDDSRKAKTLLKPWSEESIETKPTLSTNESSARAAELDIAKKAS